MKAFEGYKTYLVAGVWLLYAASGYFLGELDSTIAMQHVFEALSVVTLRLGIKKAEK